MTIDQEAAADWSNAFIRLVRFVKVFKHSPQLSSKHSQSICSWSIFSTNRPWSIVLLTNLSKTKIIMDLFDPDVGVGKVFSFNFDN